MHARSGKISLLNTRYFILPTKNRLNKGLLCKKYSRRYMFLNHNYNLSLIPSVTQTWLVLRPAVCWYEWASRIAIYDKYEFDKVFETLNGQQVDRKYLLFFGVVKDWYSRSKVYQTLKRVKLDKKCKYNYSNFVFTLKIWLNILEFWADKFPCL